MTVQDLVNELEQFGDRDKATVFVDGGSGLEAIVSVSGFHVIQHSTGNYVSVVLHGEAQNG